MIFTVLSSEFWITSSKAQETPWGEETRWNSGTGGSLVKTLASDYRDAGSYEVIWNGLNNDGQQVASGQYILKMSAPSYSNTLQMTFLKKKFQNFNI